MKYLKAYKHIKESVYFDDTNILEKFENELSKYLKVIKYNLTYDYDIHTNKIFLIDDDFGCVLKPNTMGRTFGVSIYTVYKSHNKFILSSFGSANRQLELFYAHDDNIKDFVEKLVAKLNKINKIRKINKDKREIKRTSNKYNL